jgi:uncharacterized protein YdaT
MPAIGIATARHKKYYKKRRPDQAQAYLEEEIDEFNGAGLDVIRQGRE